MVPRVLPLLAGSIHLALLNHSLLGERYHELYEWPTHMSLLYGISTLLKHHSLEP